MAKPSFTGRTRQRRTTLLVRAADLTAKVLITFGGVGTIIAVLLVFVLLASVVVPLFKPVSVHPVSRNTFPQPLSHANPFYFHADDNQLLGYTLFDDGRLETFGIADGKIIADKPLFEPGLLTACSITATDRRLALGFNDGSIRLGTFAVSSTIVHQSQLPPTLVQSNNNQPQTLDGFLYDFPPNAPPRKHLLEPRIDPPISLGVQQAIRLIDLAIRPDGPVICAVTADGELLLNKISSKKNLLTGKITTTLSGSQTPIPRHPNTAALPKYLLLSGLADTVYLIWDDGHAIRLDCRQIATPTVVETIDLAPENNAALTALTWLNGKTSLVTGDSLGNIRVWFAIKPSLAPTADGAIVVKAHDLQQPANAASAVTSLTASERTRKVAAGFANGDVRLYYTTNNQLLAQAHSPDNNPVLALAIDPRDRGILARTDGAASCWNIDAPHPESSLASTFLPVWYEGYEKPEHVWQSSSGQDAFEPKFGLIPLIFGTIKATFYAMLFGAPLAILAAIYTSEFLHPNAKACIKPAIELMASLPSVVLGFLAALVLAPFVEQALPHVLVAILTIPVAILAGAYLWQLIPRDISTHLLHLGHRPIINSPWHKRPIDRLLRLTYLAGGIRLLNIFAVTTLGIATAVFAGPLLEHSLFSDDIMAWLNSRVGTGAPGWFLMLLPLAAVFSSIFVSRIYNPYVRGMASRGWKRTPLAWLDFVKFIAILASAFVLAAAAASLLSFIGFDPRGSIIDTYVQRNALVVGFVMGFAVIPIIYTIAEDALSAVPEHLRAASLGAGATPWQTAVRVIIPTAMSGLFSAVMIGFGRAVGETMIVLMAAGNTPVLEMNIFSGMRTLSANIAVELPEAVQGSTHYRMLFLAALVLFLITFLLNTAAEMVRQRFRKRAYQL